MVIEVLHANLSLGIHIPFGFKLVAISFTEGQRFTDTEHIVRLHRYEEREGGIKTETGKYDANCKATEERERGTERGICDSTSGRFPG